MINRLRFTTEEIKVHVSITSNNSLVKDVIPFTSYNPSILTNLTLGPFGLYKVFDFSAINTCYG